MPLLGNSVLIITQPAHYSETSSVTPAHSSARDLEHSYIHIYIYTYIYMSICPAVASVSSALWMQVEPIVWLG